MVDMLVPACFKAVQQHLKPALESTTVTKVVHDCRLESALFRNALLPTSIASDATAPAPLGIKLAHVFDTSVAYALLQQVRCSVCPRSD